MKHSELKQQLYFIVLQAIIAISALSILGNFIIALPLNINLKWVFLFFAALINLLLEKQKGSSVLLRFLLCFFVISIFIPLGFIDSGGNRSESTAYIFFALIVVTYLFDRYYRYILIGTIITVFIGIRTYGHFYPEKIPVYDVNSSLIDCLIQVPTILILCFLVIKRFVDAYDLVNQKLYRYAHYDELTGLLNRRNFNDILQKKFDSGHDNGYLIMMDIDNFKIINDKKGHIVGDDVLKYLSDLLNKHFFNGKNMISRWGGDEFVIIYFGHMEELERILEEVKRMFKSYVDQIEPLSIVDISVGVAALEGCKTSADIFAKSDQIMYEQKTAKKKAHSNAFIKVPEKEEGFQFQEI
ncbi:diguanylate cyclase [Syntrophobotulus glycolicus DSM 8271]|uniref:Diguanylate cyclase n=1 Tax=Syntrophobotulus glycolicus (strain DSM 8271 / FlGlyR) TaxID=645991 RepID=F0SXP9_SYNGF|nr:GGDEF domain-containing protein [Syntrophobotulus glycolicus]ADY55882.1 diguanylate cyclase [Syntrophobotulus glycolicus DSM 8271]